ncbi:tetratricopeptide repeat protein [Polynucleobacter sp. MWH-Creno-3A4]|uniref:O-linked N-acetylglucosamine transferase, SPINDLY family protein n=1 Tax=Polynucleobacter sp. MWH-Creno-3A4 TaxID=1855886 RepID=UPI001C0C1388|nr:glycosyltransferase family 41 protein [Polynucleobacter sp. MWH-Creno-3A4]MBU3606650.1 tetratricopeptide repeat protein [Polynucleobacter sp. MWH-Creno-3A4]
MAQPYTPMLQRMLQEFQEQRLDSAERIARAILRINPKDVTTLQVQGLAMAMQGRFIEAIDPLARAASIDSKNQDLLTNLAKAQYAAERFQDAAKTFEKLNTLAPHNASILTDMGTAYGKLRQYEKATLCYDKALQIDPKYFLAWSNRGNLLADQGRPDEAISCFQKALNENPNYAEAWTNLGNALFDLGRFAEACESHDKALAIDQNYGEAWYNKANALTELKHGELALKHYLRAFEIKPQLPFLLGQLLNSLSLHCDWANNEEQSTLALKEVAAGKAAVPPFIMLQTEAGSALQKQAAGIFIHNRIPVINATRPLIPARAKDEKIRIGYFSTDFKNHPVGILMDNLLPYHDRSKFHVSGYFLNKRVQDSLEIALTNAFDSSYDIFGINDADAHQLIMEHDLDIAIDLNGHTAGARTGIFARRIAPVQLSYLGYAGTTGASFYDYLLADQIVVPEDQQEYYSEKLAYLPHSFFPADTKISRDEFGALPTRQSQGLPEAGFIYSCFNNPYKITPQIFALWMDLLAETPNSVLWLTKPSELAIINLQTSAQDIGIDPARIIFADRVPSRADHLSRLRLIDLFLDTPRFNAHTTAADALWAGVPVLTKIGDTFASRVAASQLNALGMQELVVNTDAEYREKALQLARNPDVLKQLRLKQESNRLNAPLFNTHQYVKDLEELYLNMLKE